MESKGSGISAFSPAQAETGGLDELAASELCRNKRHLEFQIQLHTT
jgi:hypothetical protein